ncbi:serine hydrolase, partial [uncultured Nevskia sp.]|uniref:serine hydrolase domain-containing protein n=1 Tax=uncultured Nevskia sp. TaxID=228950 RepID=UPI0025FFEB43
MAAGFAFKPTASQAAVGDAGLASEIGDAARSSIRSGACPGVAVHISLPGRTLLSNHYGLANIETATELAGGSVFRIGSLTKQFTAALVVKLASDGKLDLDDAVSKHLAFFAGSPSFTVRELLNHTAGLHSDERNVSCPTDLARPKSQIALAQEISAQSSPFDFEPGTAWLYSNANYIVLGAVIEQLTAMSLADAAAAMIFKPLGLDKTAFDSSDAVVAGRVDGYSPVDGSPGSFTHPPIIEISEAGGAGAMRSTASDLGRWHRALFTNRLFDRRFLDEMITPGRLRDGRLSGENRFSPDDASYGE